MELLKEINDFLTEGMVDERELLSKMDQADVHVPSASKPKKTKQAKKEKSDKWQKRIAFTTNAMGVVAAPAAISAALKDPRLKSKTSMKEKKAAKGIPLKAAEKAGLKGFANNKKVLTAGAVGAVGLQLGNATGDAISAKYFAEKKKPKKAKVEKFLLKPKMTKAEQIALQTRAHKETEAGKKILLIGSGILGAGAGGYAIHHANKKGVDYANPKVKPKMNVSMEQVRPVQKSDDLEWSGEISKVDEEKRQVFGWCSLTKVNGEDVIDRQGDYIPLDEVEKSAYNYVIHSRKGGDMHKRDGDAPLHTSDLIESFVVTPEKLESLGLEPDAVPHGWWVGFKVNDDDQWEAVKKGDRAHFSVHGKGRRKEVSKSETKYATKKDLRNLKRINLENDKKERRRQMAIGATGVGAATTGAAVGTAVPVHYGIKALASNVKPIVNAINDGGKMTAAAAGSDEFKSAVRAAAGHAAKVAKREK